MITGNRQMPKVVPENVPALVKIAKPTSASSDALDLSAKSNILLPPPPPPARAPVPQPQAAPVVVAPQVPVVGPHPLLLPPQISNVPTSNIAKSAFTINNNNTFRPCSRCQCPMDKAWVDNICPNCAISEQHANDKASESVALQALASILAPNSLPFDILTLLSCRPQVLQQQQSEEQQQTMGSIKTRPVTKEQLAEEQRKKSEAEAEFYCKQCNIQFRSARSLEAHKVDYCQKIGLQAQHVKRNNKRRLNGNGVVAGNGTANVESQPGQNLICRLCGYRGHSERGIRVHFNAMHSVGSEIQLEQYLNSMIVRTDSQSSDQSPIPPQPQQQPQQQQQQEQPQQHQPEAEKRPRTEAQIEARHYFECRMCMKHFPDSAKLRIHMRSHDRIAPESFNCKHCKFSTATKNELIKHVRHEHERQQYQQQQQQQQQQQHDDSGYSPGSITVTTPDSSSTSPAAATMFCDICQISFKFKHSFEAHRRYYCMAKWNSDGESENDRQQGNKVKSIAMEGDKNKLSSASSDGTASTSPQLVIRCDSEDSCESIDVISID